MTDASPPPGLINARPKADTSSCDRCGHHPKAREGWVNLCRPCAWFVRALLWTCVGCRQKGTLEELDLVEAMAGRMDERCAEAGSHVDKCKCLPAYHEARHPGCRRAAA